MKELGVSVMQHCDRGHYAVVCEICDKQFHRTYKLLDSATRAAVAHLRTHEDGNYGHFIDRVDGQPVTPIRI